MKSLHLNHLSLLFIFLALNFSGLSQYSIDFEGPGETKTAYASGTVILSGLEWDMTEALIGATASDFKNGDRSARMRGYAASSMTMLEDKVNGLGTISFLYSEFGTDPQTSWRVEYSDDQGLTWIQIGSDFIASGGTNNPETFSETLDVPGNIRVRIIESGSATTTNLRMNIDDILITDYIPPFPTISVNPTQLTGFQQFIGTPSDEQSFSVSGSFLSDDVTLTISSGDYEIALTSGGPFSSSLLLEPTAGVLSNEVIFVRLNGTALASPSNGSVLLTSAGAADQTLNLEGEIVSIPNSVIIDFEGPGETKTGYEAGIVNLSGLDWELDEVVIGTLANDFKNGARSARLRGRDGAIMQMIEDKPNGLGELTFLYREFGTDPDQQPWDVDYSADGGFTWINIATITATDQVQSFSHLVEAPGNIRVRFVLTTTPGVTGNRRMNIDDIELTNYIPDPTIVVSTSSLSNFVQILPDPSAEQSVTVSGSFLESDVTLSVAAGEYEIAESSAGPWSTSIVLSENNGELATSEIFVRMNGATPSNPENGLIELTSLNASTQTIVLSGIISATPLPEITASPVALTGFEQTLPNVSAEQTVEIGGSNLDSDIDVTVSGDFEISLISGAGFSNALTLTAIAGEVPPTTVYVRLNGTTTGIVNEAITASSLNATNAVIALSGEILPEPTPEISASTSALSGFSQTLGAPSSAQSVEVSGANLQDDLELTVSGDFEISLDELTGYSNAITLNPTSGTVATTLVYVRLNGTGAAALVEESITIVSAGAASELVELEGEILEPVTPEIMASTSLIDGFLQLVGTPSASESLTVSAENLEEDLLLTVSGEYEISLDENSGYVTALSIPESNGTISSTVIYVRLNGTAPQDPSNGVISMISSNATTVTVDLEGAIIACNVDVSTTLNDLTITANAAGMSYSWIDCGNNNAVIPGQSGQSFTATENGAYAVIVTDGLCSDTSACVVISTVGITEVLLEMIQVYPNPIENEFTIVGAPIGAEVEIFTVSGKLIYQSRITAVSQTVRTDELQSGVYMLVVRENGQQSQFRLVK